MKTPKGPFWAWTDITGDGKKWNLCIVSDELIKFLTEDGFEDYWDIYKFKEGEIVLITAPAPRKEP